MTRWQSWSGRPPKPAHPGERITLPFTALFGAALERAGALLILPRQIARTSGSIMVLAMRPDDLSIRLALELAATLKERLVVATNLSQRDGCGFRQAIWFPLK